ncbi:MAG: hypothetical protein NPIRA03_04470 [Nitrospirales bacterium]|nr:MAG: hypothetical protein NPIRA03_04470 [Nitrospirales bacterium]
MFNVEQDRSTVTNWKWLREIVVEASQPIGPYWPMKTFAYYNPIRDLEHLPFRRAIEAANQLLGAKGFLPVEEYRQFFHQGRITPGALEQALRQVGPPLPSPATIQICGRAIHVRDIWRIHAIYGIEELNPVLHSWMIELEGATTRFRSDVPQDSRTTIIDRMIRECEKCRHDPEFAYLHNLWKSSLEACQLADPLLGTSPSHASALSRRSNFLREEAHSVPVDLPTNRTLGDWLDRVTGSEIVGTINTHMIKWVAAFVDEGVAGWSMPEREKGFYAAWRELAQGDLSGRFLGIPHLRQKFRELSDSPEEMLCRHLQDLNIPKDRWREYLSRHLAQLPGWAGFIRWRGDHTGYPAQADYPIDPLQYLAVRLFYESGMVEGLCQREWGIKGTLPALLDHWNKLGEDEQALRRLSSHTTDPYIDGVCRQAWRIFHLAQFLELTLFEVHELSQTDVSTLLEWLDLFPESAHGPVWLDAYEEVYREQLLKTISGHQTAAPVINDRPRGQGIFCIDARSESFRRHLEDQGPYETFGYAGFFGVPMSYVGFDSHDYLALCPILLTPTAEVSEMPRVGQNDNVKDYLSGTRWHQLSHHLFHDLKHNPFASFLLIDVLGMFFSVGLLGKTLFRTSFDTIKRWVHRGLGNTVATQIPVEPSSEDTQARKRLGELTRGFTILEQAAFVEGGLRVIGLTKQFGRFVMVCGHGSQSDNNPYYAALDCGACGGSHGDPNARVFSAMANNPEVRKILNDHNLVIPEDTWFLPAKHNTTTDRVTLYDLEDIPATHVEDLALLVKDLEKAGTNQALERCRRIPGAPTGVSPRDAFKHVRQRSMDWANSRPEWGLSGNAAFLIGRRALTKGLDLEGRVFLHSYDPGSDPDGGLLEKIMTAPLIVGELINLTYYFSAVDPWAFGSGSKVIHNMVAGVGVMLGSQSDLQKGLPLQSVNDGARHYHEPMRLLAIIEAPPDRIRCIIQKHDLLQHVFHNQWMHVVAFDPGSKSFSRYLSDFTWEPVTMNI